MLLAEYNFTRLNYILNLNDISIITSNSVNSLILKILMKLTYDHQLNIYTHTGKCTDQLYICIVVFTPISLCLFGLAHKILETLC